MLYIHQVNLRVNHYFHYFRIILVRVAGLEPTTSSFQVKHSTRLSYTLIVFGWEGRGRTYDTRIQSALPYHLATSQHVFGSTLVFG